MLYTEGMLVKHFKGKNLIEKNIYRIEKLGVNGSDVNQEEIKYTGDGEIETATNLVIYESIFQGKKFCREYEDISGELSEEKKEEFEQTYKVQPLTLEEIKEIERPEYIEEKNKYLADKYGKPVTLVKK